MIPLRSSSALGGGEFASLIMQETGMAREAAILEQVVAGNVPDFLRALKTISLVGDGRVVELDVLPDVVSVGTDDDFVRMPMTAKKAQQLADLWGMSLITPALSDAIWLHADVRIDPINTVMPPTDQMSSTRWYVDSSRKIEKARAGRTGLIAGHKKDVVLSNSLSLPEFKDRRVGIYGWHQVNGVPIQGMNPSKGMTNTHDIDYVDYSQCIRLVSKTTRVNGVDTPLLDIFADPQLAPLINRDGVLTYTRYPTD